MANNRIIRIGMSLEDANGTTFTITDIYYENGECMFTISNGVSPATTVEYGAIAWFAIA